MNKLIKTAALAFAATGFAAVAAPAAAFEVPQTSASAILGAPGAGTGLHTAFNGGSLDEALSYNRGRYDRYDRRNDRRYARDNRNRRAEPVRTWRGRDGRVRCEKKDGTVGLLVGGAAGALLGREIDRSGDRALGTVLGAAGGALLGNEIAGGTKCR